MAHTSICPRCQRRQLNEWGGSEADRATYCDDCAARAYSSCSRCDRDDATHHEDLVYCLDASHAAWHVTVPAWWRRFGSDRDGKVYLAEPACWRTHQIRVLNVLVCERCFQWEWIGDNLFTGALPDGPAGPFPPAGWRQLVAWLRYRCADVPEFP